MVQAGACRKGNTDSLMELEQMDARGVGNYAVGDEVWLRVPGSRCGSRSRSGVVTGVVSAQVVEVDGMPWHVRDVRHRGCDRSVWS